MLRQNCTELNQNLGEGMMKKSFGFMIAGFFCMFASLAFAGEGPAFDCAKAESKVDKTICSSKALSALDRTLDTVWRGLIGIDNDPSLKEGEREWIKKRNAECKWGDSKEAVVACLNGYYRNRIAELTEAVIATSYPSCKNADLALDSSGSDAGMSHAAVYLALKNTSKKSCSIKGWPSSQPPKGFGIANEKSTYFVSGVDVTAIALEPGQEVWFSVSWTGCGPCDGCVTLKSPGLTFGAPGDKPVWNVKALDNIQVCDMGKGGGVQITPVTNTKSPE